MFKADGKHPRHSKSKEPIIQPKVESGLRLERRPAPPVYRPTSAAQAKPALPQFRPAFRPPIDSKPFERPQRPPAPPVYRPASLGAQPSDSQPPIALNADAVQMTKSDTLRRKKERKIRKAKIYSGQHGGEWVPSGSAGGVRADDADEETKAEAIARLSGDVDRSLAAGNPAVLVRAIRRRIAQARLEHGPDPEWQHFEDCLTLD